MADRRAFIGQLGVLAAAMTFDADELDAASLRSHGLWDTSWLESLASAQYRVVFNTSEVSEGNVLSYVA